jgi:hypothetical protein
VKPQSWQRRIALGSIGKHMQSPTLTQQLRQLGNEAGAIPNVRLFRPSERALTDDIASLLKQQPQRLTFDKRRQQATGMIEVQMRQDHVGDVIRT